MKNNNLNTLTSIGVHYQRQSVFSILSHCSDTYQRAQNHKTLGPSTSHGGTRRILGVISTMFVMALLGGIFFSHSAYAGTSISIASGSSGNNNVISFGNVKPSNSGSVVTASDELTITTDCAAGSNVYISATNNSTTGTNLVNNAGSSNNTIATLSGTTIGTTALSLENNTWGFNTDNSATSSGANNGNGVYYGLPTYANATDHAIYSGANTTVPIYYGAKVTSALVPGKYIGQVLYTATVNSSCLNYTVIFDKNANDATGTMDNQTISPAASTPLTTNSFERPGYIFLGWSTDQDAATATYADGQAVTDLTSSGSSITLYAVWGIAMQNYNCANIPVGTTITLYDSRDKQAYTVYRWANSGTNSTNYPSSMPGFCLMTKDLSLGYVTGGSITKGGNLTLTADTSAGTGTITARTGTSNWSTDNTDANLQYINGPQSGQEAYSSHSYYSYGAAQKVCPKGWRLPTNAEYGNIVTFMGGSNATGSSKIRGTPYNFVYGGNFTSSSWSFVGSYGYYWSSTQMSSSEAYSLLFGSSLLGANWDPRNSGLSVRCVAEPPTPDCSDTVHPTTTTGCKMADNKTWILGNNGGTAAWTALFTNATGQDNHDATLISGKCPSGYSAPKKSDYDTLVASYSNGGSLYTALGLSGYRFFWSSTEYNSNGAYYLYVTSSDALTGSRNKSYTSYLLCVK